VKRRAARFVIWIAVASMMGRVCAPLLVSTLGLQVQAADAFAFLIMACLTWPTIDPLVRDAAAV
jgi:hypothetical protein